MVVHPWTISKVRNCHCFFSKISMIFKQSHIIQTEVHTCKIPIVHVSLIQHYMFLQHDKFMCQFKLLSSLHGTMRISPRRIPRNFLDTVHFQILPDTTFKRVSILIYKICLFIFQSTELAKPRTHILIHLKQVS